MEVKQDTEWTTWSVALVSIIQSVVLKDSLLTVLAEKIECSKVGVKWKLGGIPDIFGMILEWNAILACGYEAVEAMPKTPSIIAITPKVLTLVAWWASLKPVPMYKKASNYSQWVLEIGHWLDETWPVSEARIWLEETWYALALDLPLGLYPSELPYSL